MLCAEVNTVPPNPRSLRFHQRLGFAPVAELEPWADEPGHLVAMVEKPVPRRVGSTELRRADVRLVSATHRDLHALIRTEVSRRDARDAGSIDVTLEIDEAGHSSILGCGILSKALIRLAGSTNYSFDA